jgi:hypothetical protein
MRESGIRKREPFELGAGTRRARLAQRYGSWNVVEHLAGSVLRALRSIAWFRFLVHSLRAS